MAAQFLSLLSYVNTAFSFFFNVLHVTESMKTDTLSGSDIVAVLDEERDDSDDQIVWRSDCFLIPGTPRLLGDERPLASRPYS